MELWEYADNYVGTDYSDYYMLYVQDRDSDVYVRSNFQAILDRFKKSDFHEKGVEVARSGHWLVGWVELILIHKDNKRCVEIGNQIQKELDEYPILDDDLFYEMETEELQEAFDNWGKEATQEALKDFLHPSQVEIVSQKDHNLYVIFSEAYHYYGEMYLGDDFFKRELQSILKGYLDLKLVPRFSFKED